MELNDPDELHAVDALMRIHDLGGHVDEMSDRLSGKASVRNIYFFCGGEEWGSRNAWFLSNGPSET